MTAAVRPLASWLDELVLAAPDDRRMIAIGILDAGLGYAQVWCERHGLMLNGTSAFAHLDRTEASHRLQNGESTRLHQLGEIRPARAGDRGAKPPIPWATSPCRSRACGRPVVWASTETGSRMPVDAWPDPAGNCLLVASGGAAGGPPLVVVLRSDTARAEVDVTKLHTSHFQTCAHAADWRRS